MAVIQLALVAETAEIDFRYVTKVSAALQKQIARDFAPIWNVSATIDAFHSLDDVPVGYWPIIVVDDVQGAEGIHEDRQGQPFALVENSDDWSLTASHEAIEMLVDPWGRKLVAGASVMPGQGRVEYLVEPCDPSESAEYGYTANGVLVSDFYTPHFFDPYPTNGVRYSFTGALQKPRQILRGGYLSWHVPKTDHWWQMTWFEGSKPRFRDIGVLSITGRDSLRSVVKRQTPEQRNVLRAQASKNLGKLFASALTSTDVSAASKATSWRQEIRELLELGSSGGEASRSARSTRKARRKTQRRRS